MERESNPMEALCRSGCGFYGNPATDGLCSVCFKEALKKKQQPPSSTPSPVAATPFVPAPVTPLTPFVSTPVTPFVSTPAPAAPAAPSTPLAAAAPTVVCLHAPHDATVEKNAGCEESPAGTSGASSADSEDKEEEEDKDKDKKKKNRCAVCRKKVGLTGFECRCQGLFCAVHRYSDKHDCSFDYRSLGAQEIRRNNPVVVSQKIHKI